MPGILEVLQSMGATRQRDGSWQLDLAPLRLSSVFGDGLDGEAVLVVDDETVLFRAPAELAAAGKIWLPEVEDLDVLGDAVAEAQGLVRERLDDGCELLRRLGFRDTTAAPDPRARGMATIDDLQIAVLIDVTGDLVVEQVQGRAVPADQGHALLAPDEATAAEAQRKVVAVAQAFLAKVPGRATNPSQPVLSEEELGELQDALDSDDDDDPIEIDDDDPAADGPEATRTRGPFDSDSISDGEKSSDAFDDEGTLTVPHEDPGPAPAKVRAPAPRPTVGAKGDSLLDAFDDEEPDHADSDGEYLVEDEDLDDNDDSGAPTLRRDPGSRDRGTSSPSGPSARPSPPVATAGADPEDKTTIRPPESIPMGAAMASPARGVGRHSDENDDLLSDEIEPTLSVNPPPPRGARATATRPAPSLGPTAEPPSLSHQPTDHGAPAPPAAAAVDDEENDLLAALGEDDDPPTLGSNDAPLPRPQVGPTPDLAAAAGFDLEHIKTRAMPKQQKISIADFPAFDIEPPELERGPTTINAQADSALRTQATAPPAALSALPSVPRRQDSLPSSEEAEADGFDDGEGISRPIKQAPSDRLDSTVTSTRSTPHRAGQGGSATAFAPPAGRHLASTRVAGEEGASLAGALIGEAKGGGRGADGDDSQTDALAFDDGKTKALAVDAALLAQLKLPHSPASTEGKAVLTPAAPAPGTAAVTADVSTPDPPPVSVPEPQGEPESITGPGGQQLRGGPNELRALEARAQALRAELAAVDDEIERLRLRLETGDDAIDASEIDGSVEGPSSVTRARPPDPDDAFQSIGDSDEDSAVKETGVGARRGTEPHASTVNPSIPSAASMDVQELSAARARPELSSLPVNIPRLGTPRPSVPTKDEEGVSLAALQGALAEMGVDLAGDGGETAPSAEDDGFSTQVAASSPVAGLDLKQADDGDDVFGGSDDDSEVQIEVEVEISDEATRVRKDETMPGSIALVVEDERARAMLKKRLAPRFRYLVEARNAGEAASLTELSHLDAVVFVRPTMSPKNRAGLMQLGNKRGRPLILVLSPDDAFDELVGVDLRLDLGKKASEVVEQVVGGLGQLGVHAAGG
jgi:hypothetical protein